MRKFGVEIELTGISQQDSYRALRDAGIAVEIEGYNHNDHNDHWKIVRDASVRGGHEVVSPVLNGIDQVIKAATALTKTGAKVNRTCGLHIHFDASDLSADAIRSICRRYAAHEAEIDAFMPKSRRGDNNRFCLSVACGCFASPFFESAQTASDFAACTPSRYYKVNLHALSRHGSIEFRQHSGTVDAVKIVNWILFLEAFIEASIRRTVAALAPEELQPAHRTLVELLAENDGMTEGEIASVLGCLPATCRGAISRARKAGAPITSERTARGTVYRASMAPQASAGRDGIYDGIPESIRAFYEIRTRMLD